MHEYDLSKTTFLRGLQCEKSLYLNQHHTDRKNPPDPNLEIKLLRGQEIHAVARGLFPEGVLCSPLDPFRPTAAVKQTQQLLQSGASVLYEAAFLVRRVLVFIDILQQTKGGWNLYEVKGTTSIKEEHYPDLSIQAYVLEAAGLEVKDLFIVHLNPDYIRQGDLDLSKLFEIVSIRQELQQRRYAITDQVKHFQEVLNGDQIPTVDLGPYCSEPYDCDFGDHCWKHVPRESVFTVARLSKKKKFDLYRRGILQIQDIPSDYPLGKIARFHVDHHLTKKTHLDRDAIQEFLAGLIYPLGYLDFETHNPAIPPYDGLRPYQQIPFQFSLHVQKEREAEVDHVGFFAEAGIDPRPLFLEEFLRATEGSGSLIVYNQVFEAGVLKGLIERFPSRQDELRDRLARLVDLMEPFRSRHLYLPVMEGSYSLKAVLPALVDDLSYSDLSIADGQTAMDAYVALQGETDPEKITKIREDLWEYCKVDTLAMVKILQKLYEMV